MWYSISVAANNSKWAFSPDGQYLVLNKRSSQADQDNEFIVWRADSGELVRRFSTEYEIQKFIVSRDNSRLIVEPGRKWGNPLSLHVLDAETGETLRTLSNLSNPGSQGSSNPVWKVSPDGTLLLVANQAAIPYTVKLHDFESGNVLHTLYTSHSYVKPQDVAFSPDGKKIAVARRRATHYSSGDFRNYIPDVLLYETESGKLLRSMSGSGNTNVTSDGTWKVSFLGDGKTLVRQMQGSLHFFDVDTGRYLYRASSPFTDNDGIYKKQEVTSPSHGTGYVVIRRYINHDYKPEKINLIVHHVNRNDAWHFKYPDGTTVEVPSETRGFDLVQRWSQARFDELTGREDVLPKSLQERQQTLENREKKLEKNKPSPPKAVQGQFETTSEYRQRVMGLRNDYQRQARAWERQAESYNRDYEQLRSEIENYYGNTLWPSVVNETFRMVFGAPVIRDAEYSADDRRFLVEVGSDRSWSGDFSQRLVLRKTFDNVREEGPTFLEELKQTQPRISFEVTDSGIDWQKAEVSVGENRYAMLQFEGEARQRASFEIADLGHRVDLRRGGSINARAPTYEWEVPTAVRQDGSTLAQAHDDLLEKVDHLQAVAENPNYYFFAIGIENYLDAPDVPFAERSTELLQEIVHKKLGVPNNDRHMTVLTGRNATVGRIDSRLESMLARMREDDTLFFYYSGHGVPSRTGDAAYLLAQDASPGSYERFEQFSLSAFYDRLGASKAKRIVGFIDACFSGQVNRDQLVFEGVAPAGRLVRGQATPKALPQKLALMTAGTDEQFSNAYFQRQHRLFSYWLMRGLLEDKTGEELYRYVRTNVEDVSLELGPAYHQTPEQFGPLNYGG
jgi:hypothetical protein